MNSGKNLDEFANPAFVARVRARDPEALKAVVHAYLQHILRAARGAGLNRERAEDVTQATFLTFISSADRFEGRSHVRTWLFGILYKKIAEARRQAQKEAQTDDIQQIMEERFNRIGHWSPPPRQADKDQYDAEIRQHIEICLENLSTRQRMAFVLREVEDLSSEEICNALEVSRTNLGVLLYRARNSLRECLEKRQVEG